MEKDKIQICDECESEFNKDTSEMKKLCPECSWVLYGYSNCEHIFTENRCKKCYWNGKSSEYIKNMQTEK